MNYESIKKLLTSTSYNDNMVGLAFLEKEDKDYLRKLLLFLKPYSVSLHITEKIQELIRN